MGWPMIKLELIVSLSHSKSKEFTQSLQILKEKIEDISTSFHVNESQDALSFSLLVQWESEVQMHHALSSDEFKILSGAINSLCDKTTIRLNDKEVGKHISELKTIYQV